ncbi:MAG: START-like domain-containing protein [Tannerellaceae bacterium]
MKKEKFHIEYIFDTVSQRSLWKHLTTSSGLSSWFAQEVTINERTYTFRWEKDEQQANVLAQKYESSIRYQWTDEEDPNAYFEFIIHRIELTGSTALEITDFAEPGDKADAINLWDTQVDELKRTLGI